MVSRFGKNGIIKLFKRDTEKGQKMQVAQAKDYFHAGVITAFDVVADPMGCTGWLLEMSGPGGKWTLHTKLGAPRVFASLDTLVGVVQKIAGRVTSLRVNP